MFRLNTFLSIKRALSHLQSGSQRLNTHSEKDVYDLSLLHIAHEHVLNVSALCFQNKICLLEPRRHQKQSFLLSTAFYA